MTASDKNGKPPLTAARGIGVAMALSIQLVASVIAGVLLGQWLDGLVHTRPLFTVLGVFVGIGAGLYGVYRLAKVLLK